MFRYGAVVLFSVSAKEQALLFERIKDSLVNPVPEPTADEVDVRIDAEMDEGVRRDAIFVKEVTLERLQLIAEVLAKSLVLEHYESAIVQPIDRSEAMIMSLKHQGYRGLRTRELLQQISNSLLNMQEMVGFVAVSEKPEILWDYPDRERFYARLEDEYEIRDRHMALDKKVQLIFLTAQTLMNLLQTRRSLRVEWYIVVLILIEIFIVLYEVMLYSR